MSALAIFHLVGISCVAFSGIRAGVLLWNIDGLASSLVCVLTIHVVSSMVLRVIP